jgi:hypothetical protein
MFKQISVKKMQEVVASLNYLAFSHDEINTIDNILWVSIHFYVAQDWCGLFVLNFI